MNSANYTGPPSVVRVVKYRTLRWARSVDTMGDKK